MNPHLAPHPQNDEVREDLGSQSMKSTSAQEVFVLPASPQQRRYSAFADAYPESRVWNVAARWSLRGPLRTDVMEKALNAVCARHEALRTCLEVESGEIVQKILSDLKLNVPVHDLRALAAAEKSPESDRRATEEAKTAFDLGQWPLVRFQLLRLEDDHYILLVSAHHAVADGWSIGIISRDMAVFYTAILAGNSATVSALPVQFADFAIWQNESLDNGAFHPQLAYWKKQLRGLVPLRIPGDLSSLPEPTEQTWNGTIVSQLLPRSLSDALAQASQRFGATLFSTALAALYVVMHGFSGRKDLSIGTQVAGRNRVEIENAIGVFSNALVLRAQLSRDSSFAGFATSVADMVIQATANQEVPYETVLQSMIANAHPGKSCLYYVNFIYQRSFIENIKFADIQLTDLPSRSPGAPYDLNFFMVERPEGWRLSLEYNTDIYSVALAENLLERFAEVFAEVAVNPQVKISELKTLHAIEQAWDRKNAAEECLILPASMGQQRYWVLDQLGQKSSSFKMPIRWRLKGKIDADALELAFNEIVRRNEIMRTTLIEIDGQPMQRVAPGLTVTIPRFDLRSVSEQERQNEVERIADAVGEGQFNMSSLPLIHAALVQLEDVEYVFCLTVHPIVCDGLAVGLLAKELFDIYDALVRKLPHALPEPDLQYGDYAIWQREFVQSPAMQEQIQYWLSQLKNYQPFEVMPDKPRPPLQTTNGAFLSLQLPKTLTDAVQDLSKKRGNSFFITAFAAFLTLLYRYTGQEDISVGTEVSGRNQTEHEQIIGLFLNTLVLRNDLSGDPRFPELLERVRDVVMQAIANQDVPFQKVVEVANPQRDPSRKPLFQVNFMLQRSTVSNRDYETFSLIDIPSKPLGALFDLNWLMVERANGWRVAIQYNTDLFEPQTIERMLAHFHKLLNAIAANSDQRLSEFEILTDAERSLLASWNDTAREIPQERTIHELFEAQTAKSPASIAAVCGKEQWTYSELDERANRFAHYLGKQGIKTGVRVGLCLERSLEMLAALLGVLKAGGTYVPLDPAYPIERLRYMLEDSQPALLITQAKLLASFSGVAVKTLCIDSEWATIAIEPTRNLSNDVSGDSDAYVLYTSGSTGNPKGVMVPHHAVVNLLESMSVEPGISPNDVLVAVTTLSFDIAVLELFIPLTTGARLVIASREEVQDGVQLIALLQRASATVMQGTPATWRILLDAGWSGHPKLKMLCGGETLPGALANELLATGGELWNLYGPTETTIWSSIARISDATESIHIGRPIGNTRFYVLDSARNFVPLGTAGELYIGGAGVASGYLNQPELTAGRFVSDPFSSNEKARLYRTGDLVRWKGNGELEFLNRLDGQVKIRGYRVELGEIESLLVRHRDVREAATVAVPDNSGSLSLVAFIGTQSYAATESPLLWKELRVHLRKTLPDYMQPSAFIWLDALPQTENGKIDRKALVARALARETTVPQRLTPSNPTEERMAALWESVLGIPRISMNANFFDLGGHSLLAAKLMTRIEQEFGKRIPLAILFQSPTIQQLSRVIIGQVSAAVIPGIVPIQPEGDKAPFFCVNGWSEMRRLALELGLDRPFLALNIPDGKTLTAPYTVEEIAAHQITTMKTIQPEGPYYLGGWCRAGVIAYEIAQQLSAKGEEVGLIVLFESWSPTHLSRYPKKKARRARRSLELWRLKVHVGKLLHMNIGEAQAYARERLGNLWTRVMRILTHSWYNFRFGVAHSTSDKPRAKDEIMDLAATNYKPVAYQGRVILFRANEYHTWKYWDPTLGWGDYLPNLEVHEVPGRHESAAFFTGPYAVSTAKEIRLAIDESCRLSKSDASPIMAR